MNIWLKELSTLWLISYDQGEQLGFISDTYMNSGSNKIIGFMVKLMGSTHHKDQWLPIESVKKIGKDVVMVYNKGAILNKLPEGMAFSDILGMKVSSKDGRLFGGVANLSIHRETHEMRELLLNNNMMIKLDPNELVLGEDVILVQADAVTTPFFKSGINPAKTMADVKDTITHRAEERLKQGGHFIKEATHVIKQLLYQNDEINLKPKPYQSDAKDTATRSDDIGINNEPKTNKPKNNDPHQE